MIDICTSGETAEGSNCPDDLVPRLKSQRTRIHEGLMAGPMANFELAEISLNYSARIAELRKSGYRIIAKHDGGSLYTYTLVT